MTDVTIPFTDESIQDVRATAWDHAERQIRALYEAQDAGLSDRDEYTWWSRRLTGPQVRMLQACVDAALARGKDTITGQWWVGTGGDWGRQAAHFAGADLDAAPSERAVQITEAILAPVREDIDREWRDGLNRARTAWEARDTSVPT